jgi:hypothetical protein
MQKGFMQNINQLLHFDPENPQPYMPELERVADEDVLFAKDLTYREEVRARARTVITEMQHGLQVETDEKTHRTAADILQERTPLSEHDTKPDVILQLAAIMNEFDHDVVEDAVRMRRFVTNKLMLEANTAVKASERIKALELLGKISDVGLFVERSVVTVEHKTTAELEQEFSETIELLLNPATNTYENKPASKTAKSSPEPVDVDFKSIEIGVE